MIIDVAAVRRDTRGCETVAHLNNAGSSLPPAVVMDTIHQQLRADEVFGGYEAQALVEEGLAKSRAALGTLVGGRPSEIAFFDSSSRAFGTALLSFPFKRGDRVLTSEAEYISNVYAYTYLKKRFGVTTTYVPDDERGQVDVEALADAVDERTRLIALTHIPNYSGLINPAAKVGAVARKAGIPFLLDACQSVGQVDIDVNEIGCDLLAASGRKYLRGPRGAAFLWVRSSLLDRLSPPIADQHGAAWRTAERFDLVGDARRLEPFERPVALHLGLGAAARYAIKIGPPEIESRVVLLGAILRGMLTDIPGVTIRDRGERLGGIVTFTVDGLTSEQIRVRLRERFINTSITTQATAMRSFRARDLTEVTRVSAHYYNTEEELARVADAVRGMASKEA
ncbi:MAG: aminotransferase class V-fold PLP-dependent enzyme [Demequinaceae bacterium]|nr:aminotransferase class V-fold PLP-dependent enzyme [Demequinaceae bacterium]